MFLINTRDAQISKRSSGLECPHDENSAQTSSMPIQPELKMSRVALHTAESRKVKVSLECSGVQNLPCTPREGVRADNKPV